MTIGKNVYTLVIFPAVTVTLLG